MTDKAIEVAIDEFHKVIKQPTSVTRHAIIAAIAAYEQAMWRPIEEAKKDGTIIDVWLGDASESDVNFYCTEGTRRSPGWSWYRGKFRPCAGLDVQVPVFVTPTHYRPLPPRPGKEG